MYRFLGCLSFIIFFQACSSDNAGNLLQEFPITYKLDKVESLGISSYYYTDTIIYKTRNDLTDSIEMVRDDYVQNTLFNSQGVFIIEEITFLDATTATITGFGDGGAQMFTEVGGIGLANLGPDIPVGFRITPDLSTLITCFTQASARKVDTLYEGSFEDNREILFSEDSTLQFQLVIEEIGSTSLSNCVNVRELAHIQSFSSSKGLVNDDRIISHRTDIILSKVD